MGSRGMSDSIPNPMRGHIVAAIASLAFGAVVYLARPSDPVAIGWAHDVGFETLARATEHTRHFVSSSVHLPAWFRGSASDAAFGFALGASMARASRALVVAGMFVVVGHELGQGLKLFAGTFDPLDLVVLVTSYLIALASFRLKGVPCPSFAS
jgi:hypothetical protein